MNLNPDAASTIGHDLAKQLEQLGADYGHAIIEDENGQPEGMMLIVTDPDLTRSVLATLDRWQQTAEAKGHLQSRVTHATAPFPAQDGPGPTPSPSADT